MLNLLLGFLAQLVFINIAWRRPIYGLCLLIILLPSYLWRFSLAGLPTTFLELMLFWLFIIWLIKHNRWQKINWLFKPGAENLVPLVWRYLISAWLLVSIVAWLNNPTLAALGLWRAYFLEPILFFILFIYLVKTPADLKLVIKSLGLLLMVLFVLAGYQNLTAWNLPLAYQAPNVKRLTAIFSYPNALSLLTAPITAFFAALYLTQARQQYLYLLLFFSGFLLSWWAVSQGAVVGIIVAITGYGFYLGFKILQAKTKVKTRIWLFSVLLLLGSIFLLKAPMVSSLGQQLFDPQLDLQASSLEIRSSQWQETWAMLKDNWWNGAGLAAYQSTVLPYHQLAWLEIYLYPHNTFLNFWSELGFLGLSLFLLILYFVCKELKKLWQQGNTLTWPLIFMWLTWFVHGLVDVPYFKNDLSILFFLQLALLLVARRLNNKFTF